MLRPKAFVYIICKQMAMKMERYSFIIEYNIFIDNFKKGKQRTYIKKIYESYSQTTKRHKTVFKLWKNIL